MTAAGLILPSRMRASLRLIRYTVNPNNVYRILAERDGSQVAMSPRPYRLGQRQAANEQTRARIISAAHHLLSAPDGISGFTVDAVAREAGVARMTVYYQFGSKPGLIEALFDDIAARGGMLQLSAAFQQADPQQALGEFIRTFCRFWASDRLVIRRVHALAALDPDLDTALRAREEGRRRGLRAMVGRLGEQPGREGSADDAVDALQMLTSFEAFDWLAGATRDTEEVVAMLQRLARATVHGPSENG